MLSIASIMTICTAYDCTSGFIPINDNAVQVKRMKKPHIRRMPNHLTQITFCVAMQHYPKHPASASAAVAYLNLKCYVQL